MKRSLVVLIMLAAWLMPTSGQAQLPDDAPRPSIFLRAWRRGLNQLYTFDPKPLGDRTPVILVPGRAEEVQFAQWWRTIGNFTKKDATFQRHYKLYLYLYDSSLDIPLLSNKLTHALVDFKHRLPNGRRFVLVSYSQGGLMAYDAMETPEVFEATQAHVAMAVPFHGTPMFSEAWFQQHFKIEGATPLRQKWDLLMHRLYLKNKRTLTNHMNWNPRPPQPLQCEAYPVAQGCIKQKMWVYGSYVSNMSPKEPPGVMRIALETLKLPYNVGNQIIPIYLLSLHKVFRTMSMAIGNLPDETRPDHYPFKLNDGVVPLASALFLPATGDPLPADLPGIQARLDIPNARIFADLDHMDYAELHRTRQELRRPDLNHPQEGTHTPLEWLVKDLETLAHPEKNAL